MLFKTRVEKTVELIREANIAANIKKGMTKGDAEKSADEAIKSLNRKQKRDLARATRR